MLIINLNRLSILTAIILLMHCFTVVAQGPEFTVDEQYKQAMLNAKTAFEAKRYSDAVMLYKEAQRIKPNELLPRYKIEDIRTIYIKNELDTMQLAKAATPIASVKKSKKEQALEAENLKKQAEAEATRKMEADAEQALALIVAEPITQPEPVQVVEVEDDAFVEIEDTEIEPIAQNRETGIAPIAQQETKPITTQQITNKSDLTLDKREQPVTIITEPKADSVPVKKSEPKPTPKPETVNPAPSQPSAEWIKEEQKRLAEKYPNKKTIEEIEQPGKKITRVVMNIDNKVVIYLKVVHSWGATFYFLDETGQALRSINQQYFNVMTNLETYGN